jgi:hypothetical protein
MAAVQTAGDLERQRLREANGYHGAIQQTDDSLTLKPVEPTTAAAYKKTLHEWNLFVHFRRSFVEGEEKRKNSNSRTVSLKIQFHCDTFYIDQTRFCRSDHIREISLCGRLLI